MYYYTLITQLAPNLGGNLLDDVLGWFVAIQDHDNDQ